LPARDTDRRGTETKIVEAIPMTFAMTKRGQRPGLFALEEWSSDRPRLVGPSAGAGS